jgi:hypothetical protein
MGPMRPWRRRAGCFPMGCALPFLFGFFVLFVGLFSFRHW